MKSKILAVLTIVAVVAVTSAMAGQSCPVGKSDCKAICQGSGACDLNKGCGMKDKEKSCDKDKKKSCDKDKDKSCDKNKDKDQNQDKDPNSQS